MIEAIKTYFLQKLWLPDMLGFGGTTMGFFSNLNDTKQVLIFVVCFGYMIIRMLDGLRMFFKNVISDYIEIRTKLIELKERERKA